MGSIPVHFAWSRDLYQSAAVTFTVYEAKQFLWRRQAQDGRQGVGTTLSHFVQAVDPIVGPQNQALDRIGATAGISWFLGSQAQPIASEECALWRRQRSLFAEKLAVHLITIGLHT